MRKILTALPLIILIAALSQPFCLASVKAEANGEECAVYAAAVKKLFYGNKVTFDTQSPVSLLVVKNRTISESHIPFDDPKEYWEYVARELSPISQETITAYQEQNRESRILDDSFGLPIRHVLVDEAELDAIRKEHRWDEFYKKYPDSGGFIAFSRVGFNSGKNQALVFFEHWCHQLCGSGIYLFLSKDERGWKVTKMYRAWIS